MGDALGRTGAELLVSQALNPHVRPLLDCWCSSNGTPIDVCGSRKYGSFGDRRACYVSGTLWVVIFAADGQAPGLSRTPSV